jgi:hypothetical protein
MSKVMPVGVLPGLVWLAAAANIRVEGTTTCPTPEMVATRLTAFLPPSPGGALANDAGAPQRARLIQEGDELVVELQGQAGDIAGTRRFTRSHTCDALASAVAVSLAVWVSDVHPEFSATRLTPIVPRGPAGTTPDPGAPPMAAVAPAAPARGAASQDWRFGGGVALGFGGSVDIPVAAADVLIAAWARPPRARTYLRAEVEGQSERQVTLQEGKGVWRRWIMGVGLERALAVDRDASDGGWLRAAGMARLAVLDLHGEGFPTNHRDRVLDAGVAAGVRAVRASGSWAPWLELSAALWPIGHDAVAGAATTGVQRLPVFETFVRVGAGWDAGR